MTYAAPRTRILTRHSRWQSYYTVTTMITERGIVFEMLEVVAKSHKAVQEKICSKSLYVVCRVARLNSSVSVVGCVCLSLTSMLYEQHFDNQKN